jgi:hypothetical protein
MNRSRGLFGSRWLVGLMLLLGVATGCAGGTPAPIDTAASRVLSADVDALAGAAHDGIPAAILAAARTLRDDVSAEQRAGAITGDRAAAVLVQLDRLVADTGADVTSPAPSPSITPPPPEPAHPGKSKQSHGKP